MHRVSVSRRIRTTPAEAQAPCSFITMFSYSRLRCQGHCCPAQALCQADEWLQLLEDLSRHHGCIHSVLAELAVQGVNHCIHNLNGHTLQHSTRIHGIRRQQQTGSEGNLQRPKVPPEAADTKAKVSSSARCWPHCAYQNHDADGPPLQLLGGSRATLG